VVALAGDLPCLSPRALEYVLELANAHDRSLLSDAQGSGTAMLLSLNARALDPHFGPKSRSAHVQRGCIDLGLDVDAHARSLLAGARRDVDTPADLWDARRIGVGRHTADVLRRQR
jgi:2-phospho-L-lactate guanylyltransferase